MTYWISWEDRAGIIRQLVGFEAADQADARRQFEAKHPDCRIRSVRTDRRDCTASAT